MSRSYFCFIIFLLLSFESFSQKTYVPDDNFEQFLIVNGLDNALDDSVLTSNINNYLATNLNTAGENVVDLTVINDLDIYPNPSRDVFNISFNTANKLNITLRIRNIVGEEIYTEELKEFDGIYTKSISLENYPKAVYFLEISTADGTINKKLVLQ